MRAAASVDIMLETTAEDLYWFYRKRKWILHFEMMIQMTDHVSRWSQ